MNRRDLLARLGVTAVLPLLDLGCARKGPRPVLRGERRVRPSDREWPSGAQWEALNRAVGGQLIHVRSPLLSCREGLTTPACAEFVKYARNPYYLGDEVALTQTLGWVDAWSSQPSIYAVAARTTADVVAAVNFAREHRLRLAVKGGGHSYLGTSNAPESLLVWTRRMNAITVHERFVAAGCAGRVAPQPAVTMGAGAIWMQAYTAVTTRAGRYVQGGGCTTVGVAGLVQSGGFGSFSKRYGLAAAALLEAEVVTADGAVLTANACTHPDLFWAIKGGGGGSFGVVTRLTLRTRELPETFGVVDATIKARSEAAFRRLVGRILAFYADALFNPHWGEQIVVRRDDVLDIRLVFQGLTEGQATSLWRPFFDWVASAPSDFEMVGEPRILALPARSLWDVALLKRFPGVVVADDRPGAPEENVFWVGDAGQVGQFLHGFQSLWLSAALLRPEAIDRLADVCVAASRHWPFSFHFNKGLAGAPPEEVAAARDTAMNPAVLDAFALVIAGAGEPPAYPGVSGHEPDVITARRRAAAISRAMHELRALTPEAGSYVSESDFFEEEWRRAYWGANYPRLLAVKDTYDPGGLFIVHHGVGSERWSPDGFTRLA